MLLLSVTEKDVMELSLWLHVQPIWNLFFAKHTGSTNDVVAIQGCEGGRILLDTSDIKLPSGFYGVGDEAFV
jgi:hypothetical protein